MLGCINPLVLLKGCQALGSADTGLGEQLEVARELQVISDANEADVERRAGFGDISQLYVAGPGRLRDGESSQGAAAGSTEVLDPSPQPLAHSLRSSSLRDVVSNGHARVRALAPTGGADAVRITARTEGRKRVKRRALTLEGDRRRVKTQQVRKRGACFRCSAYKEGCDADDGDCRRCRQVLGSPMAQWSTACFRLSLPDCSVIRESSPLWGDKSPTPDGIQWLSLSEEKMAYFHHVWPADELKTAGPRFEIRVKEFRPQRDDPTGRKYQTTGGFAVIDRPHYATMEDMETLTGRLESWIEEKRGYLLDVYGFGSEAGGETSRLMNQARGFARENKGSMVDLALNVLVGSRLNSSERSVSGLDETEPISDENSILNNVNPISPRLDYQLDMAVVGLQKAQLSTIFKRFDRKTKAQIGDPDAAKSWWEIFLAIFLLMQTAQFVHKTQKQFPAYILADYYTRAEDIQKKSARMIEKWEISSPNLADAFLYYCRRHFGGSPFRDAVVATALETAGLRTNGLDFLRDKVAKTNENVLEAWKNMSKGPPNIRVRRITEEELWWTRLLWIDRVS